jgi:hypothetical protein
MRRLEIIIRIDAEGGSTVLRDAEVDYTIAPVGT